MESNKVMRLPVDRSKERLTCIDSLSGQITWSAQSQQRSSKLKPTEMCSCTIFTAVAFRCEQTTPTITKRFWHRMGVKRPNTHDGHVNSEQRTVQSSVNCAHETSNIINYLYSSLYVDLYSLKRIYFNNVLGQITLSLQT